MRKHIECLSKIDRKESPFRSSSPPPFLRQSSSNLRSAANFGGTVESFATPSRIETQLASVSCFVRCRAMVMVRVVAP